MATVPSVLMIASSSFVGVIPPMPSGTTYTASVGDTIAVKYADRGLMSLLGFVEILAYDATASSATGNVVGPASSIDNHVALFDGITGELLKDGGALPTFTLDDLLTLLETAPTVPSDGIWRNGNVISLGTITP